MTVRIERVMIDGRPGWMKRVEVHDGLSKRLRKGNGRRAFELERQAYREMEERGLPFPRIVKEGDGYFVTEDAGPTLQDICGAPIFPPELFSEALPEAARALARMHSKGFSHGRPVLRDICYQNGVITFLDLENNVSGIHDKRGHANDLLHFFYNTLTWTRRTTPDVLAARDAYRELDEKGVWDEAVVRVKGLRPVGLLLRPLGRLFHDRKDFRAINPFYDFFLKVDHDQKV